MKDPKKQKGKVVDAESFIAGATTEKGVPRSKGKLPAAGYTRTSFDLPSDLHTRLKVAAAQQGRPMQELLKEALEGVLK